MSKKINPISQSPPNKPTRGRPHTNLRATLDGIWWILRTGSPWNQLPEHFGKWNSVYRQHLRWSHRGLWSRILELISQSEPLGEFVAIDATHNKAHQDACRHGSTPESQALGKTKGGRNTKINALVNSQGHLLRFILVPGNQHEIVSAPSLLRSDLKGVFVLGDKGYISEDFAVAIVDVGAIPHIPPKKGAKGPLPYDPELGKRRRVVENFFARLKRSRRVATRYDRLAVTYISFIILAALDDWVGF